MSTAPNSLRLGTLGGAATFAGEATRSMRARYPEFGEAAYFPSMDAVWDALKARKVDVIILGSERTGQPHHGHQIILNNWTVIGEITQPLGCNLYFTHGASKSQIRKITGHGSTLQCVAWLEREFPGIARDLHSLNSLAAAKEAVAGDGRTAVVGTQSLPDSVPGLQTHARQIDAGALSSWWAITDREILSDTPRTLIVTARLRGDGSLGRFIAAVSACGFGLAVSAAFPVDEGCSVYDYLLEFTGAGKLADIRRAIAPYAGARIAGAFEPRFDRIR